MVAAAGADTLRLLVTPAGLQTLLTVAVNWTVPPGGTDADGGVTDTPVTVSDTVTVAVAVRIPEVAVTVMVWGRAALHPGAVKRPEDVTVPPVADQETPGTDWESASLIT